MLDARQLDPEARRAAAWQARRADFVALPALDWFRSAACDSHAGNGGPDALCWRCGVALREHQQTGAAWLYLAMRALLADSTGTGKTPQVAALLAMCLQTGEVTHDGPRALVLCRAAALGQWARQLARMLPELRLAVLDGNARERARELQRPWHAALIGPEMLVSRTARGSRQLEEFGYGLVVADDIAPLRNQNKTSRLFRTRYAQRSPRVVICDATPLNKRLTELYDLCEPMGSHALFGPPQAFAHRYVETRQVWYTPRLKPTRCAACKVILVARGKDWVTEGPQGAPGPCPVLSQRAAKAVPHLPVSRATPGPKFNTVEAGPNLAHLEEFRGRLAEIAMRRTAADIPGLPVPVIRPNIVTLEMTPAQAERYALLRDGALRMLDETGREITRPAADAIFLRGQQICSGLAALDGPDHDDSAKLDWAMSRLEGDLAEEKAVVFIYFRDNVEAFARRLAAAGIGHELIWGAERGAAERDRRLVRFRDDPSCRVLAGTTSMEASLDLQAARHMILADTVMNPARMTQLVGRVARIGSAYPEVYAHMLRLAHTQETAYDELLAREQAIHDDVFDEHSQLFRAVTPLDLVEAVAGRRRGRRAA